MMDGWDVDYLGADVPTKDLSSHVARTQHLLVALSIALRNQQPQARAAIDEIRTAPNKPWVIVGGRAVTSGDVSATSVHADAVAQDASQGLLEARRLLQSKGGKRTLDDHLRMLGERIQALHKERGWSQQQLADESGLNRTYISAAEHGKQNLSLASIVRLAEAFDVGLEDMLLHLGTEP
jgi:DNA-binding XRE family transcriptional regulator